MKKFKVKEVFKTHGWTYVEAETEAEAIKKLENGFGDFEEDEGEWHNTDWNTLTEI